MADVWASGAAYEQYIGRWSRPVATQFLSWLGAGPGLRWLDIGCGTGALTSTILAECDPRAVLGVDPAEGFVAWAAEHVVDPRAQFRIGKATELPADSADVVVSGLVVNFLPDLRAAMAAMCAAAPGGTVACYVWDYAEGMQLLRYFWDAVAVVDPASNELDEGRRFPICRPDPLQSLFVDAGLRDVAGCPLEVATRFAAFDDLWSPFLGGQGPAPSYLSGLDDASRDVVREAMRARVPVFTDGSVELRARAWAVRGTVGK